VNTPKSELRKQIESDIMCTCGCRAPMNNCPMGPTCHGLKTLNEQMDSFLARGMTREQVRAAFVAAYGGQDILTAPIDKGFNRLAWAFPYIIGVAGAVAVGVAARRWSHHTLASPDVGAIPNDPQLTGRLDDELRDLD
jgi:hypothetical protein